MIEFLSMMLGGLVIAIVYAGYQVGRLVEVQARPIQMRLDPEWTEMLRMLLEQVRKGGESITAAIFAVNKVYNDKTDVWDRPRDPCAELRGLVDQVRFLDSTVRMCSEELTARLDRIADKSWR